MTGGAGFIGTNLVRYWCEHYPGDRVIVLDALTYAGNRCNLEPLEAVSQLRFVQGDICDRVLVDRLLAEEQIDAIVHCAAESHVDRSILGPAAFIHTNVVGTFTLLEAFRHHWQAAGEPGDYRFLQVSTDEVYGSLGADDPAFCETTAYAPNSPYAASKAGADHLVRAYFQTYGLPTLVTHCTNNYGPYQFPEKLIPRMVIHILQGKPLPIYGDGRQIRDWLYVGDHCEALACVLHRGQPGEHYNIGSCTPIENLALVYQLCALMDELAPQLPVRPARRLIRFVADRPGHDRRYEINPDKIRTQLGWHPRETFAEGLRKTVAWYLGNPGWWRSPEYP